jgi:hypothetical protein
MGASARPKIKLIGVNMKSQWEYSMFLIYWLKNCDHRVKLGRYSPCFTQLALNKPCPCNHYIKENPYGIFIVSRHVRVVHLACNLTRSATTVPRRSHLRLHTNTQSARYRRATALPPVPIVYYYFVEIEAKSPPAGSVVVFP